METVYQFIFIFFIVLTINLIGEKLINNRTITKNVFIKNSVICVLISVFITIFNYIQQQMQ